VARHSPLLIMKPERWQQLKQIFQSALERDPAERSAFLNQACGGDAELRSEVESLISSHDEAGHSVEVMAAEAATRMLSDQARSIEGKQIERYQVLSRIGRGGMGEVFLAQDTRLNRKVALKLLRTDFTRNEDRLRRFRQEAQAASALNHPNILTIHEIGQDGALHFMATEYVEGETLRDHISRARMSLGQVLEVAVQVASALSAAHQAGIIHRDIKPENIMVRTDGYVKVLDFGLAKLAEAKAIDSAVATLPKVKTEPGLVMGTVSYMSPEQARGLQVDARTDTFSLGVLIYEMVAGRLPFEGSNTNEIVASILSDKEPLPLARYAREIPAELERIVSKALRKERDQRSQTTKDLLLDLQSLKQEAEFKKKLERSASPRDEGGASTSQVGEPAVQTLPPRASTNGEFIAATSPGAGPISSVGYIVSKIKQHKRGAAITLIILVLISVAAFFYLNRRPNLTEKDTILLADFVNTTGDPVFDLTLRQALAVQLGQTPFLNIYPDDRIQETLRLMNRKPDERITKEVAREICERNGIKAMLLGSIASLGNNYVITLEALNPRTGEALAREQIEAAGKEQVLGKLGDAAKKLREKLGESLQTIEKFDASVEQATTSSLEALKAFSIGQQLQMAGKTNESIPFHKRAIELDPNFASAYKNLGEAYFFTEQPDRAAEPFTKAFELRERVSQREKFNITARYYQHVVGDVYKTGETLELWKQTYPRQWNPRFDLASYYNAVGQHEKAVEEAQEAIRLNLHGLLPYSQLANAFAKLNRFEEAKAALEAGLSRGQSVSRFLILYRIAFVQGDRATMQQQIDGARGKPEEEYMHSEEGRVAMFDGQVSRAEKSFRRGIELAEQRGANDAMSRTHAEFAIWNSFFGNCTDTRKSIANAFSISRGEEALKLGGIALAVCGEIDQAQSIAEEVAKFKSRDLTSISVLPEMRAAIEISRNNPAKAVEILESTRILERGFGIPGRTTYLRGIAYLRLKAGTEAMNEFQKILDRRGQFDTSPLFPLAYLGLARAATIAGDTTKSRRAYQDFFAIWKDADADLPILIEAKKEYEKLK